MKTSQELWNLYRDRAKAVGWTLSELCKRAGVHRSTLSQWRSNKANPNTSTVRKLDRVLEVMEQAIGNLNGGAGA